MFYKIYCDGAASNNGYSNAIGGWAYIILNDKEEIVYEESNFEKGATNNRMELYAAYMGLYKLLSDFKDVEKVEVYTDSAYLHNCISQQWYKSWIKNNWKNSKKQPVANKNLWEYLIPYFMSPQITFLKVKGHSDNKWNEYVDNLAVAARLQNN